MLKISDALLQNLIEEMKRQVDFKTNKKNFVDAMLNKKIKFDTKTKEYFDFLHKEKLIFNTSYKIKNYDKTFVQLFENMQPVNVGKYSLSLYKYQKEQCLSLKEALPTYNYLQGKNIGVMENDLTVPCITFDNKPFCIMPIKEIMYVQKYEKPRGRILIVGVGTGCSSFYYDKDEEITDIDVFEPNVCIREIFKKSVFPLLSSKVQIIEEIINPWVYDKIFVCDDFLDKNMVHNIFKEFHQNKKVKFTNYMTLTNELKLEIFRQIVIFIGDTSKRSEDSEIGKNVFDFFQNNEVELNTLEDFICFIDDNFAQLIKSNI